MQWRPAVRPDSCTARPSNDSRQSFRHRLSTVVSRRSRSPLRLTPRTVLSLLVRRLQEEHQALLSVCRLNNITYEYDNLYFTRYRNFGGK